MRIALVAFAMAGIFYAGCAPWSARIEGGHGSAGAPVTTGWVEAADILRGTEHAQFAARYDTVAVDTNLVGMIGKLSGGTEALVYYGSWCSDSRREVPRFLRILDKGGFTGCRVRFYALDRTKRSPDGLTEKYGIDRVPTFLFFRDGVEIGRVVEVPRTTLEGDIIEILVGARTGAKAQAG